MTSFLSRFFQREEMDGGGVGPVFLVRWRLLSTPWGKLYAHKFCNDDAVLDPHDHPKDFTTIGLWGGYREEVYDAAGLLLGETEYRAPWVRRFSATHIHRLRPLHVGHQMQCWTLAWVGVAARPWGFYPPVSKGVVARRWVPWREYIDKHARDRVNPYTWS